MVDHQTMTDPQDDAEDWYQAATRELSRLSRTVRSQDPLDLIVLTDIAKGMTVSLERSEALVVQALSAPLGDRLIANLVHVGILAARIGLGLDYSGRQLEHLTIAGLLHDIGIFSVPPSLIQKPGKLTPQERAVLEQHPEAGFKAIRQLGPEYEWLATVVRQAHERWSGQGYPQRLKGSQIHPYAQVIGLADVFEALVSPRPYRRRMLPHDAIRELLRHERGAFPRTVLKALVEQLSVYPLGTKVRLSSGDEGLVIRLNSRFPMRPVVQVGDEDSGGELTTVIDLSSTPDLCILDAVAPPEPQSLSHSQGKSSATPSGEGPQSLSDRFSALLEGLDQIAMTIQQVVESQGESLDSGPSSIPYNPP
jgi:hypothetical protein